MSTINLLILLGIIFAYITIGGGVYLLILWHDKAAWDDYEASVITIAWPLVIIMLLPCIAIGFVKWLWIRFITLILLITGKRDEEEGWR